MKCTTKLLDLKPALAQVTPVIGKPTLPAITMVKLTVGNGKLVLETTDLECAMTVAIPATHGKETGSVLAPAKQLNNLIRAIPSPKKGTVEEGVPVEFSTSNGRTKVPTVSVTHGGMTANLTGMNADEFPPLRTGPWRTPAAIEAGVLLTGIQRSFSSVATDDSRPVLTSAKLEMKTTAVLAAADGFVLTVHEFGKLPSKAPKDFGHLLIPIGMLRHLKRTLKPHMGVLDVSINKAGSAAYIQTPDGNITWTTALVQGTFPDTGKLIPDNQLTHTMIDADATLEALKPLVTLAKSEEASGIIRCFTQEDGLKWVVFVEGDLDGTTSEVKMESVIEGDINAKVAINATFLEDVLKDFKGEQIDFSMATPSSPMMFMIRDEETGEATTRVIMPMHVEWTD